MAFYPCDHRRAPYSAVINESQWTVGWFGARCSPDVLAAWISGNWISP
jgi:hypothetical protein